MMDEATSQMTRRMTGGGIVECPRCGSPLEGGIVEGLCARCLGALNFDTLTRIGDGGDEELHAIPTVQELAPFFPQLDVLSLIGRGGMGVVYKARQKSLRRNVALKLLAPERAGDPMFSSRFAREAQSLAALNHPHIVGVYDFGEAGGYFYLLMEYVDGVNLRQLIESHRLSPEEALEIITTVCDALQAAHERGIVHRDVKPENLLIDRQGTVKIADFGISRMLEDDHEEEGGIPSPDLPVAHSLASGTPDYAAPEQRSSGAADHRADIYSLGVVLYEMITGQRPGNGLVIPPSRRAAVGTRIDDVVLKALQTEPDQRFRTVAEFRDSFQAASLLENGQQWSDNEKSARRRRRGLVFLISALALAAMVAGGLKMTGHPILGKVEPAPAVADPAQVKFASLEDAYRAFEENFSALQYARELQLVGMPGGEPAPPLHAEFVKRLEDHDREIRAAIERMSKTGE